MSERVVVYVSNKCPYCERVKEILTENDVDVKEKNITLNERHYKQWKELDVAGTPTTCYKDMMVVGVVKSELIKLAESYKNDQKVKES